MQDCLDGYEKILALCNRNIEKSERNMVSREEFCTMFGEDLFEAMEAYLDTNGYLCQTTNFILFYNTDTEDMSIIDKDTLDPKIISWYKLRHLGRGLDLNRIESKEELKIFLNRLRNDLGVSLH